MDPLAAAIVRAFPDLAGATFRRLTTGWHSIAVDVDDRLIFKFPRHDVAARALVREAALLAIVGPSVTMPVPALTIHRGPPLFSRHEKVAGEHLLPADYQALPEDARCHLAQAMARFYAELHRLAPARMAAAGAGTTEPWQSPVIRAKALPVLPMPLRARAAEALAEFEHLPPDPHGATYGFFDGHGWNMAFDHARRRLNGVYDFADSGIGPLDQEFIYSNLVSPDLTGRIATAYERLTGRILDRRRIATLTGVHRLWELAELADDPEHAPAMVRNVAEWAAMPACGRS